jgi:hypothetical protein
MAKKTKHALALDYHIKRLGGPYHYRYWCERNSFSNALDKTPDQLATEQAHLSKIAQRAELNARLDKNPRKLLEAVFLGEVSSKEIDRPLWKSFAATVEKQKLTPPDRAALHDLCLHVFRVADFLLDTAQIQGENIGYLTGLISVYAHRKSWLRKPEDWKPDTHNADRQFRSLLRHLFARYDVPEFFDQVWLLDDETAKTHRSWYIYIAAGGNMRTVLTPVPLTKMMAHHMMRAPAHYTVESAIRWGQIHALGGDASLTDAVVATVLGSEFGHDEFWLSVFKFFIQNPMLDRQQVGPVIDFLRAQKFEPQRVMVGGNQVINLPPPQPNLSMRGRNAVALLDQVEKWHIALNHEKIATGDIFAPSGIKGLRHESSGEKWSAWTITELRNSAQLREEGKMLSHCVLSYARSCVSGHTSIWSMEREDENGKKKHQTIEVNSNRQIVQCRGKHNRIPTAAEFQVLERWAKEANLKITNRIQVA